VQHHRRLDLIGVAAALLLLDRPRHALEMDRHVGIAKQGAIAAERFGRGRKG
jgi:hypothetical protein